MMPVSAETDEKKVETPTQFPTSSATQCYEDKKALYYVEKDTPLTDEHRTMYNALRTYADDVLARRVEWALKELDPRIMSLSTATDEEKNTASDTATTATGSKTDVNLKQCATDAMYKYLQTWATERTLIRGLTGSDYRLEIAKVALLETVQWRVLANVDQITPDIFKEAMQLNMLTTMHKRDKKGHLVVYFKLLDPLPADPWIIVKAAVWHLEKSSKIAEQKGLCQTLFVLDIENLKYSTLPPYEVIKQVAHILQYYYPERLFRAYICFAPWVFRMIWKMVSALLTENTKGKIIVPDWNASSNADTFKDVIDKETLLKRFGGDILESQYSYEWEVEQFQKTDAYKEEF